MEELTIEQKEILDKCVEHTDFYEILDLHFPHDFQYYKTNMRYPNWVKLEYIKILCKRRKLNIKRVEKYLSEWSQMVTIKQKIFFIEYLYEGLFDGEDVKEILKYPHPGIKELMGCRSVVINSTLFI